MLDFVKITYPDKEKLKRYILESNEFDIVNDIVDVNTGELKDFLFTKLGVLDIEIYNRSANVKNSLHKMYNYLRTGDSHNYNDFSYTQLCETIDYLTNHLIDLDETYITQFEFGFNLVIDMLPEHVIRRNILLHKKMEGSANRFYSKGQSKQFVHSNFTIKVYDKGKHYNLNTNILRLEIKFTRRPEFLKLGVSNIQDFKIKFVLERCFKYFIMRFDQLVIVDDIKETEIVNNQDYLMLNKYTNSLFWSEELRGKHGQTVARHREKFDLLLRKYDLLKTKNYLRELLLEKFTTLMNEQS